MGATRALPCWRVMWHTATRVALIQPLNLTLD